MSGLSSRSVYFYMTDLLKSKRKMFLAATFFIGFIAIMILPFLVKAQTHNQEIFVVRGGIVSGPILYISCGQYNNNCIENVNRYPNNYPNNYNIYNSDYGYSNYENDYKNYVPKYNRNNQYSRPEYGNAAWQTCSNGCPAW